MPATFTRLIYISARGGSQRPSCSAHGSDLKGECRVAHKTLILAGLSTLPFAALARAAEWPFGPIRIIVPFPPGGSVDAVGRVLSPGLQRLGTLPSNGGRLVMPHFSHLADKRPDERKKGREMRTLAEPL